MFPPQIDSATMPPPCASTRLPARLLSSLALLLASARAACPSKWGPDGCVFASHMVLASSDAWSAGSTPARVWGQAGANEQVTITGLPAGAEAPPADAAPPAE